MTKKSVLRAHRFYGILLSIFIVLAGICLIAGCLTIYYSGQPYSREAVASTFSVVAAPVYIALLLTAISLVWELLSPTPTERTKPPKAYGLLVQRLTSKKDLTACDEATRTAIAREHTLRRRHTIVRTVLLCIGVAFFLLYSFQTKHFHTSDINHSIIRAMLVALPCFAVPFGYAVFTVYSTEKSLRREIDLLKPLPAATVVPENEHTTPPTVLKTALQVGLLVLGLAALVYGYFAGGTADVLAKAVNICTECIGLG